MTLFRSVVAWLAARVRFGDDRGDVPGWVMVTVIPVIGLRR